MRKWCKSGIVAAACLVAVMVVTGAVDFARALAFERPIFALPRRMADDGGSGIYWGLGYSVEIRGIFLSVEEEPPGVTNTEFHICGIRVAGANKGTF